MKAVLPVNEADRLAELLAYDVLDTAPEQAFDDLTLLASVICEAPIALISLVDHDRQWFKSRIGLEATSTSRDVAFCAHAIVEPDRMLVVPDATIDLRFADNPLVTVDPAIRFYAGAPLVTGNGNAMGTLCVMDRQPRELSSQQREALAALARQVVAQLDLRATVAKLEEAVEERERYAGMLVEYQRRLEEKLAVVAEESISDPLTGLPNRRALLERLEDECARSRRNGRPLSVALLDVDHFKAYNDHNGHVMGDRALEQIAEMLQHASRPSDLMARYGGEEFAVVLADTGPEGAFVVAERLRTEIERSEFDGPRVTVSIGVVTSEGGMCEPLTLIEQADRALYEAKRKGRNRVVIDLADRSDCYTPGS